jgi:hypothetical protein
VVRAVLVAPVAGQRVVLVAAAKAVASVLDLERAAVVENVLLLPEALAEVRAAVQEDVGAEIFRRCWREFRRFR